MKARKQFTLDPAEAVEYLREILPPGSTAYTVLRHVSRSGMSRSIDVYAVGKDGPLWLSPRIAVAIDAIWDDTRESIKVGGCGMDMGFSIVYDLSATLYGYAQDGRSKRMQPRVPLSPRDKRRLAAWRARERKRSPHHANTSGGYAISHRWM